eukprot:GHVU01207474.1.p5 GENE.GHVU01207474.1~~GHVU01207474.1.p5  ORF type:complete len:131 (-),score=8.77 GHVU01207474.1:139-531(-)
MCTYMCTHMCTYMCTRHLPPPAKADAHHRAPPIFHGGGLGRCGLLVDQPLQVAQATAPHTHAHTHTHTHTRTHTQTHTHVPRVHTHTANTTVHAHPEAHTSLRHSGRVTVRDQDNDCSRPQTPKRSRTDV